MTVPISPCASPYHRHTPRLGLSHSNSLDEYIPLELPPPDGFPEKYFPASHNCQQSSCKSDPNLVRPSAKRAHSPSPVLKSFQQQAKVSHGKDASAESSFQISGRENFYNTAADTHLKSPSPSSVYKSLCTQKRELKPISQTEVLCVTNFRRGETTDSGLDENTGISDGKSICNNFGSNFTEGAGSFRRGHLGIKLPLNSQVNSGRVIGNVQGNHPQSRPLLKNKKGTIPSLCLRIGSLANGCTDVDKRHSHNSSGEAYHGQLSGNQRGGPVGKQVAANHVTGEY